MHLKIQKRKGREYLSIVQNYRQDGVTKTRTVETIGYADAYADAYSDPVEHFRAYVEHLNAAALCAAQPITLSFGHNDTIPHVVAGRARLGAAIALGCLDALGAGEFFHARAGRTGFPPHAQRIFEMLAAERMMHVASKRESWTMRGSFPRTCDFSFEDVYTALPCFSRESRRIDEHLFRRWEAIHGPVKTDRIYLVCGSFTFPDGSSQRPAGTPASLVVALDWTGKPIGYYDEEGVLDIALITRASEALKERFAARRGIIIAGTLRNTQATISGLTATGDGFILLQQNTTQTAGLTAWVEDESAYHAFGGNVRMKSRVSERALRDGRRVPVKEIALEGGGYALRQGRAVLVTSETDMGERQVIQSFRELWRQAEPFQPLEADFSPMPTPVSTSDHIRAHFAICYAAFFALRMLRWKMRWQHNAADTADALLNMEGAFLQQNYYLFDFRNGVSDDIETALGVASARRLRTRAEIRSIPGIVRAAFTG